MVSKKTEIPLYTKIGIRVTAVLMLVIGFFLIRNCSSSVYYGAKTPETTISDAYNRGVADGRAQASGKNTQEPFVEKNPALKNAYQRGFRAGWDAERKSLPNTLSPTSKKTPTSPNTPNTTTASDREGK